MRAGPRPCRVDANQAAVVAGLHGRDYIELARYGCPVDLAVHVGRGYWIMVEVKPEGKRDRLTDTERDWWERGLLADVVTTAQELADAVGRAMARLR